MTPPTGTSLHLKQNGKFSFRGKVSSYKTGRHIQRDYILQWISLKIFKTRHTISHPDTRLGIPDQYFVDFSSFYLMNFPLKHKHFRLLPFRGKTFFSLPKCGVKFSILAHVESIWMELEMKLECEIERNVCLKYICVPKPFKRLFQKVMRKALISWIRVRKFITTDKRKLFYEPSSAKLNSWNFLFISQRSSRIMFPKEESDSTCLNCV